VVEPGKKVRLSAPWIAIIGIADAAAIKALAAGTATEHQQRRALDWIIKQAAKTYEDPFDPTNSRVTDYRLGRRSVGLQLVELAEIPMSRFKENDG